MFFFFFHFSFCFYDWRNIFLAPRYQPEPDVVSIPVEPTEEYESEQSPGYTRNQRRKRSLPPDNSGRLTT